MALEIVSEGDQHQAALIHCETLDTVEAFQGVFDDLIAAWELYFSSPDMYYLLPSVLENGVHTNEAGIGDHWPEILVDYYPGNWQEHAADLPPLTFWDRVAAFPACWPAASTFLETILSFNDREPDDPYAYEGWEEDELQICEVAVTALAVADLQFVPLYLRFLKYWDLGHEVFQTQEITAICNRHGWCDETEELLITRASIDGQHGPEQVVFEQRDFIKAHCRPLDRSPFFRRLVTAMDRFNRSLNIDEPNLGSTFESDDEMKQAAALIIGD